jgi:serine/threonine-protein kinase
VPIAIGDVLAGKYRVERVLGVGGMGVVVQATHLQLDQLVALKFMLGAALHNPPLIERFAREARAAVRLRSDHVARVLDVGTLESGSPYIVMEYLEGSDLGTLVERSGRFPVEAAVDCLLQACDAVAEAHALGIVHRDLKPKNLFLTYRNDGRPLVKVLDFGISKQKTGGDLSLTRTTEIIGSPNYMSPEQFRAAKAADERSDIWALGVILYELLTGELPFPADTVTQLTAMVLSEPPRPIQSLRAEVPEELVRVVERCMEKAPDARFQTVAQLAAALHKFAPPDARDLAARIARIGTGGPRGSVSDASSGVSAARAGRTPATWTGSVTQGEPSPRRREALVAAIAAVAVLAAGAGGAFALSRGGRSTVLPSGAAAGATARVEAPAPPSSTLAPAATSSAHVALPPALATVPPVDTQTPAPINASPSPAPHFPPAATAAAPTRTVAGPATQPASRARADAATPTSPDEGPRYRTNW